jgi:hypothetical protein
MEQELTETPHRFARTANIIQKGIVARFRDVGLIGATVDPDAQARAVLATTFVFVSAFSVFALHYWSIAMNLWNEGGTKQNSLPVTFWLGAATVLAATLTFCVVIGVAALLWFVARDLVRREAKGLAAPFGVVVGSITFLTYMIVPQIQNALSLQGVNWLNPGQVIKLISLETDSTLMSIYSSWADPARHLNSGTVTYVLTPLVLIAFALSAAKLIRRTQFTASGARRGQVLVVLGSLLMVLFVASYLGWVASGGPPDVFRRILFESFLVYRSELALMILLTALGAVAVVRTLRGGVAPSPSRSYD